MKDEVKMSNYGYTPRRGFRVLFLFSMIIILGIVIVVIALQGCAPNPDLLPKPTVDVVVMATQESAARTKVEFVTDPANPGFECGVLRESSGAATDISCSWR